MIAKIIRDFHTLPNSDMFARQTALLLLSETDGYFFENFIATVTDACVCFILKMYEGEI